jgi:hypothetical protein
MLANYYRPIHRPAPRFRVGLTEIDNDEIRDKAPSVFADAAHAQTSDRYAFLPTIEVVDRMRDDGWAVVMAAQQRIRNESREGFQKHILRFRRRDQLGQSAEFFTDVVLVNSHDRSCAYQLHAGIFRLVCGNGMIVADSSFAKVSIKHLHFDPGDIIDASANVVRSVPALEERISRFRSTPLSDHERTAFAEAALLVRYDSLEKAPIRPEKVLEPRRYEDGKATLWNTFNVIQENLIRGGLHDRQKRKPDGKRFPKTRAVKAIDADVKLNKALWHLAEALQAEKSTGGV